MSAVRNHILHPYCLSKRAMFMRVLVSMPCSWAQAHAVSDRESNASSSIGHPAASAVVQPDQQRGISQVIGSQADDTDTAAASDLTLRLRSAAAAVLQVLAQMLPKRLQYKYHMMLK